MTDLQAIAKDAAERVHKNGGCVPQLAFAPILFALQDAFTDCPHVASPASSSSVVQGDAGGVEMDEAFCEGYYQAHLDHAWSALREGKPYQVNADGAISLIQQAAADRRAVKAWQMSSGPQPSGETREAVSVPMGAQHSTATDFPPDEVLACVGSDDAPVSRPAGEGEREAVARVVDGGLIHYGADGIRIEDLNGKLLPEKYAGMEEASQALAKLRTDAILALLSPAAPAPVAGDVVARLKNDLNTRNLYREDDGHFVLKVREDDLRAILAALQQEGE